MPETSIPVMLLVFFLQAEDGIRDADVTGVQTCALPIYGLAAAPRRRPSQLQRPDSGPRGRRLPPPHRNVGPPGPAPPGRGPRAGDIPPSSARPKIGRASCRERGERAGVAVAAETKSRPT